MIHAAPRDRDDREKEFLRKIAQDIRGPVGVLAGYLEFLDGMETKLPREEVHAIRARCRIQLAKINNIVKCMEEGVFTDWEDK